MYQPSSFDERLVFLLSRWGEKYLWRMQFLAQLVSSVIAGAGILFIIFNTNLSVVQMRWLVGGVIVLLVVENIILLVVMRMVSPNAYARLTKISKGELLSPDSTEESLAWKEIVSFPWKYSGIAGITSVILDAILTAFMILVADVGASDATYIVIGSLLINTLFVSIVALLLETLFAASRVFLFPNSLEAQLEGLSSGSLNSRLQLLMVTLILIAILVIVPMGYQEVENALSDGGGDLVGQLPRLQFQLAFISFVILVYAGVYTSLFARSITRPISVLVKTMQSAQKRKLTDRAQITATGDIGILSVYFNQMLDQLETFQTSLEKLIEERTIALEIKSTQLKTAALVAREAAATQDPDALLSAVVKLISDRFGFYHVGIFLLDEAGEYAILRAASSEGGRRMLERGHRLEVGRQGVVGLAAFQNHPHIAMDVGKDAVFFNNPDLPLTHSEAALPLSISTKVIGVLDIQSTDVGTFKQEDIDLFLILADQVALAIQNARLIHDSQVSLGQLESIAGNLIQRTWQERTEQNKPVYRYTPAGVVPIEKGLGEPNRSDYQNQLEIPIVLRGSKIGRIVLKRRSNVPWLDKDEVLAMEISDQVGLALENARFLDETQQHVNREKMISKLTSTFSQYTDPDSLLQAAVRELHQLPNVSEVSVVISPPEKPTLSEG